MDTSPPLGQHPLSPLNRGVSPPPFLGLPCPRGGRHSKLSQLRIAWSLFLPYLEVINSAASDLWGWGWEAGMPRAGAGRGRQCVGGVGSTVDEETGSDAPETKSPRMGFRGWDSGEREGWMGSGAGASPPREIPPRGVIGLLDRPPLLGHRTGDSGVGLAPLLPTSRTRTQFVLTTRSLIGPPTRSR